MTSTTTTTANSCARSVTGEHLWINYGGNHHWDVACFACQAPKPDAPTPGTLRPVIR